MDEALTQTRRTGAGSMPLHFGRGPLETPTSLSAGEDVVVAAMKTCGVSGFDPPYNECVYVREYYNQLTRVCAIVACTCSGLRVVGTSLLFTRGSLPYQSA